MPNTLMDISCRIVRGWNILVTIHSTNLCKPWLGQLNFRGIGLLVCILFAIAAVTLNYMVRTAQYDVWDETPQTTKFDGSYLFSTTDAGYFLGQAEATASGEHVFSYQRKRYFPTNLKDYPAPPDSVALKDVPLLSVIIAFLSGSSDKSELIDVSHRLIPITAALTAAAIILAFGASGYWLEGSIAALGGGLSSAYLIRSSAGRIDTDQLNLGLMYFLTGLAIFAARAKDRRLTIALTIALAVATYLFMWWYDRPQMIFILAVMSFWLMVTIKRNLAWSICLPAVLLISSGSIDFSQFATTFSTYTDDSVGLAKHLISKTNQTLFYPNSFSTIGEASSLTVSQSLIYCTGSVEMGVVCGIGLALFAIRHPALAATYTPLISFVLLNFAIGNRALFYAAPAMWFGAAFLLTSITRFIAVHVSANGQLATRHQYSAVIVGGTVAFAVAWTNSLTTYVPRPVFSKPLIEGLSSLKQETDATNPVVATWWDYGYASMFFNGLPTLHDGGTQATPTTHFVARSLLSENQAESINILRFLAANGTYGIAEHSTVEGLETAFNTAENSIPSADLYLVLSQQMANWVGSISAIANWDIEAGERINIPGLQPGSNLQYTTLTCGLDEFPNHLTCNGVKLDLQNGLLNGRQGMFGWTHSQDGHIVQQATFDPDGLFGVLVVEIKNQTTVYLVHRQLYTSTFNELFHFGQVKDPRVSLYYDAYPHIRIYKITGRDN